MSDDRVLFRQTQKLKAIEYKGEVCLDCRGKNFLPAVFHFHHRDPLTKEFTLRDGKSWDRVKTELDKCNLLCANCHITRHAGERQGASQCR